MIGPTKISGVYPTTEIKPTAVPVIAKGILPSCKTAKYNVRMA